MGEFLMTYFGEINKSMKFMAQKKKILFLGQSTEVPGNLIYKSLEGVKKQKK